MSRAYHHFPFLCTHVCCSKKKEEEDVKKQQALILGKGRKKMSFSLGFKM